MTTETPTEEQVAQSEMDKFVGGTTTDGVPSDGEPTEDENAKLAEQDAAAAQANAAAEASEAKRVEDEKKAAEAAAKPDAKAEPTPEEKAAEEAEAAAAAAAKAAGKKTVQERINEKTRAQRTAERERDAALAELAALKGEKKPLTTAQPAATATDKAPNPADFEFGELDTKYISALARYEVRQELEAARKAVDEKRASEAQAAQVAEFQARVDAFAEKGAEKFADFQDLVVEGAKAGDWDLSPTVGELILDSEYGHEIAHFLASDPDESRRIAKLPPSAQAAKFGRLEAKFEAEAAATSSAQASTKTPKTTQAPPPLKTPRSNAGQFQVDGSTKDFAAFEALAKAG
jgi:hypothetical protein